MKNKFILLLLLIILAAGVGLSARAYLKEQADPYQRLTSKQQEDMMRLGKTTFDLILCKKMAGKPLSTLTIDDLKEADKDFETELQYNLKHLSGDAE